MFNKNGDITGTYSTNEERLTLYYEKNQENQENQENSVRYESYIKNGKKYIMEYAINILSRRVLFSETITEFDSSSSTSLNNKLNDRIIEISKRYNLDDGNILYQTSTDKQTNMLHGEQCHYGKNGIILKKYNYKQGIFDGNQIIYTTKGNIKQHLFYYNGEKEGIQIMS